jgi:hypothetical protein
MTISPILFQMIADQSKLYSYKPYYDFKRRTMSKQDKITHAVYFALHAITIALLIAK